jgi:hypothetical protein
MVQEIRCPNGRSLQVALGRAARRALDLRQEALCLELELYFSCLVRKRVHVRESADGPGFLPVMDKLHVRFRPVVTRPVRCARWLSAIHRYGTCRCSGRTAISRTG